MSQECPGLMGAAKEPELYRCAIGNVGVNHLEMISRDDIANRLYSTKLFFDMTFFSEDNKLYSPNLLAHKIEILILLAAGDMDFTAPLAHTKKMNAALLKNKKTVEMVIYPDEGHGNYLMVNKLDFAERLLKFLDSNIGNSAQTSR